MQPIVRGAPSVIVRTKDSDATLGRVLRSLRGQTVDCEIVVVDSGSRDESLAIAHAHADQVLTVAAADFTFGRALNIGAEAAAGCIHFALSSHSLPPAPTWIERSMALYERADVAATSGAPTLPASTEPLRGTHYQTVEDAIAAPWWGMSNTGASWRADVWRKHPFNETIAACEDKEWAHRVLADGWTIAVDASLSVSDRHRREHGLRALYRRSRREFEAIGSFAQVPRYTLRDLLGDWMNDIPTDAPFGGWRRRLNYYRAVELAGRYRGLARAGEARRGTSVQMASTTGEPVAAQASGDGRT